MQSEEMNAFLSRLPNMLADDVPEGGGENDNKEVRKWGAIKTQKGPEHGEIGEKLGLMDFETAAKMSGARFTLLSGGLARLERALAQFSSIRIRASMAIRKCRRRFWCGIMRFTAPGSCRNLRRICLRQVQ